MKQARIKKRIYHNVVFLLIFLFIMPALAEGSSRWGIGIILGEPTGLSFKLWTGRTSAFDAAAAWSFRHEGKLHLHLDYLIHNFRIFNVKSGKLPLYFGIGSRVKFEEDMRVGVRIPVGICYLFKNHPLDIFFEIVPLLDVAPETEFGINGSLGIRYFF